MSDCGRRAVLLTLLACPFARAADDDRAPGTVDFYSVQRAYSPMPGWAQASVETNLVRGDYKLAEQASSKLAAVLKRAVGALPTAAQGRLQPLRYFLLWGAASPQGGLGSGMRYVRPGEPNPRNGHDPRWAHAVVIYSAENLMYLDDLWSKKALVHEIAHAWYLMHWSERHPPILQAWENAVRSRLYQDVIDYKNRRIASAYALKNPLEYFAELSAARFVGINYHPFDRSGLERYDPIGYRMVESLWAVS